ncbi:type II toxin-antitoxin system CcdA family antitoxin [Brenneria corticis]|uniref:Acetoacetyl-CoA synthase n=1 Tax=Brenneria corticis TaxID=2173106 RepID=A0A2U1U6W3_9GAMM|nr:type II toxin-antitoxin system CcdA family antitoxin [Brenneria sp. CFCC 11842]PWC17403.1 acetoacetyl-CoA synthase [Brenneria sp. CFCC 11842]
MSGINSSTAKKRANVTVNAALLSEAKACGINLSSLLEESLKERLRQHRRQKFIAENKEAFESHNAFLATAGLFSDGHGVL